MRGQGYTRMEPVLARWILCFELIARSNPFPISTRTSNLKQQMFSLAVQVTSVDGYTIKYIPDHENEMIEYMNCTTNSTETFRVVNFDTWNMAFRI